jgi:hypothetical protein
VLDEFYRDWCPGGLSARPGQYVGIGVYHGDLARCAGQPGAQGELGDRYRDQVIVAEQQDPLSGQRACLVHAQDTVDLGRHRAVRLVELALGLGGAASRMLQLRSQSGQLGGDHQPVAMAARAAGAQLRRPGAAQRLPA